jgi:hypothetical protein
MIQRFLFDGVDTVTAGTAVGRQYDLVVEILADEAQAALVGVQLAEARAQVALNASVVQLMPVAGVDGILIAFCHNSISLGGRLSIN